MQALEATCDRKDLLAALTAAGKAVSGHSTLPILGNLLVEGNGNGKLRVVGNDLELSVEAWCDAEVQAQGAVTVPARVATELAQRFPADVPVTVAQGTQSEGEGDALIQTPTDTVLFSANEGTRYRVRGLPAEEYSTLPALEGAESFSVPIPRLLAVIRRVVFAATPDETRPMLTGALLDLGEGALTLVATDTHRLALTVGEVKRSAKLKPLRRIIPARALLTVAQLWGKAEGSCSVSVGERLVEFSATDLPTVTSRLIEGEFPNHEKVIPTEFERSAVVAEDDVPKLREALARILVVACEDANRVVLNVKDGELALSSDSQDVGRGVDERIPCEVDGEPLEIAFNGIYLSEALAVTEGDVTLQLAGALSPGKLTDSADPSWLYVLMPMQIM